jgi:glucose/arabinose dehydrogenase
MPSFVIGWARHLARMSSVCAALVAALVIGAAPGFATAATQAGGLLGTYYPNTSLSGTPVLTRVDVVDFVWSAASGTASPGAGLPADGWSVRWVGNVLLPSAGTYSFEVIADDGVRVWINGALVADKWSNGGNASYQSAAISGAAGAQVPVRIEHYDGTGDSTAKLRWKTPASPTYWAVVPAAQLLNDAAPPSAAGLSGRYFANTALSGTPVITRNEVVDFVWSASNGTASPGAGVPADGWSVRWTGFVKLPTTGTYTFEVIADDGIRAWVNGVQFANRWANAGNTSFVSAGVAGSAGALIPVTLEHYDGSGDSTVKFRWKTPSQPTYWVSVPLAQLQSTTSGSNTPPSVSLSAPTSATVGVAVTLGATASDTDGSVARVEFFDGTTSIGSDTTSPYSISWTPATAGTRSLTARATDNVGAVTTSAAATVNVAPSGSGDTTAPSVGITSPANFADNLTGNLTISATATDNVGVTGVEIEVDGVLVADDTAAPYQATIDTTLYASGQHIIRARSRDAAGNRSAWLVRTVRFGGSFRNVPSGFTRNESWVTGLGAATAFTQAPDGRFFVAVQDGRLLVVRNGALLPTPFLTLTTDTTGERGLLGVALHPSFASNGWVYVYYTRVNGSSRNNRISRFVASGDVSTGVETVIADLPALSGANHNGGAMLFGADGKLYVAVGDNSSGARAQNVSDPFGKLLRFNDNGSVPSDNPFCTTQGNLACAVWAYGLRNPFTLAVQSGTGRIHVNDVGENTWEEVNVAARGANYGWPSSEGPDNLTAAFTAPVFVYKHTDASPPGSGPGGFLIGRSVIGGAFYPTGGVFPAQYHGKYFFADYVNRWVAVLDTSRGNTAYTFATVGPFVVGMRVGLDGALYLLGRDAIVRLAKQ